MCVENVYGMDENIWHLPTNNIFISNNNKQHVLFFATMAALRAVKFVVRCEMSRKWQAARETHKLFGGSSRNHHRNNK